MSSTITCTVDIFFLLLIKNFIEKNIEIKYDLKGLLWSKKVILKFQILKWTYLLLMPNIFKTFQEC